MTRHDHKPDVQKTTMYAIVVNGVQMLALLAFVLYVTLADLTGTSRYYLQAIAIIGALLAGWGAFIDIQDALLTRRRMRTISELQTVNEQMETLNFKLRAQRHDFLNHLQVVYSLMEMDEYQEATDYLEKVYTQLKAVSTVLRTGVTAFNALLQVKNAACEQRGIQFVMDIRSTLEGVSMPSWELCCVIGNLLDNAMDAAVQAQAPEVSLRITETLRSFEFVLLNNGATIPPGMLDAIFEEGVTTKGEGHGMGLAIVRQRLDEYGGSIHVDANAKDTAITVTLPREAPRAVGDRAPSDKEGSAG
ncbi:MAG: Spo0B domain-containing protein [Eubacteriales bacterium]|nr:Spo0B domain-containing protein [Eubacteriales bacterium]